MWHAADLTQRVTFQSKSVTRNALGDEVVTWNDEATVWAQVLPLTNASKEESSADQVHARQTATVRIYYKAEVVPGWRMKWDDVVYEIDQVAHIEGAKEDMELTVYAGVVNDG